jgi:hypothetical protein
MGEHLSERPEWLDFMTLEGITRKAGVPQARLPQLVVKELVDNAADAGATFRFGVLDSGAGFFVEDDGSGLPGTDEEVARLFSVNRPMVSTKHVRKPRRGALGNGLRVVAGTVRASGGSLTVKTNGRSLALQVEDDGSAEILNAQPWDGTGTRIEVSLGPKLPVDEEALFEWAYYVELLAGKGDGYRGNSSPWWYGPDAFWTLLKSHGDLPVRAVVEKLDGCNAKASEVARPYLGRTASSLTPVEAADLLRRARAQASPVGARRLGKVGAMREHYPGYGKADGELTQHGVKAPFVVEVWACMTEDDPCAVACVNRTPVTAEMYVQRSSRDKKFYFIQGCEIATHFKANKNRDFVFLINVECPVIQMTTDGKSPDFSPMRSKLIKVLEKAANVAAKKALAKKGKSKSQKKVILTSLEDAIERVSGGRKYRYSLRQLFYAIRPSLISTLGREPKYGTFSKIITEYEADCEKDLPGIYRDTRGVLYHPHMHEEIPLGTLAVEKYKRPEWTFHKILYCEKEGFFPMLKDSEWPERNDCALLTSKGFATRAVCDVIDLLGETEEPLEFFCTHDADGPGTVIYEAMQQGAAARPKRKVEIHNLGLEPEEAVTVEKLDAERVEPKKGKDGKPKSVPVASYVPEPWRQWLQTHRVELNAMTTPEFLRWLDKKMQPYNKGKLIPPQEVLAQRIRADLREKARAKLTTAILERAGLDNLVEAAVRSAEPAARAQEPRLCGAVGGALAESPADHWTKPIGKIAEELAENAVKEVADSIPATQARRTQPKRQRVRRKELLK